MGLSYMGLNFFKEIAKMSLRAAGGSAGAAAAAAAASAAASAACINDVVLGGRFAPP